MAPTMASTLVRSHPSEKFGTHSTSVDISQKNSWGLRMEARLVPHTVFLSTVSASRMQSTTQSKDPIHSSVTTNLPANSHLTLAPALRLYPVSLCVSLCVLC